MPEPSLSARPLAIDQEPDRRWLPALIILAIALRLAARAWRGEESFLSEGYTFYLTIADTFLQGDGLCYSPGQSCAIRLPVYPLFIAAMKGAGWLYPGVAVVQALMGGATVWATWSIGRGLFGPSVAILSAAAVALNPYAVIHDTALQDTALVNLLVLAAVAQLMKAARTSGSMDWGAAGGLLALAVLTSARVGLFIPFAAAWAVVASQGSWRDRGRRTLLVALPVIVALGGWIGRNVAVIGAPVLTTESGVSLFKGNSSLTFLYFPAGSMDLTAGAMATLPADQQQRLEAEEGNELAQDRVLRDLALEFIAAHPAQTVTGMARKLWVVASAQFSPARAPLEQWAFRLVFLPLHLLALAGAWRARHRLVEHFVPLAMVVSFAVTTVVYWAHTSHKSLIDPVIFIYAAAGIVLATTRSR